MKPAAPEILAMPRRAYSYARVSDPRQAKTEKDGLRRQDDFAQQICAEEGWVLDDTLAFVDKGKSGFHGENLAPTADLARFLQCVKSRRVTPGSVLIIENIDRLSRQELDLAYDLFRDLLKAGIWIATKTPRRIYKKEQNSFMDLMEPLWLMYLAYMESLKKSERISAHWEKRRKEARETRRPHGDRCRAWLRLGPDGYEVVPERGHTIKTIFRLATEGLGILRIVAWLNEHRAEHPPFGRADRWLRPFVRQILRSRAVRGEYQPRVGRKLQPAGEPIKGYYPEVVSEEEWQLAQAALDGRRRKAGRPGKCEANLFTGIVWEAVTRRPMSVDGRSSGKGTGMTHRYIIAYQMGPSCTNGHGMPYKQFEAGILRAIDQFGLRDVLPSDAQADERERRLGELVRRLGLMDRQMTKLDAQIEDPENVDVIDRLTKSLKRLKAEKRELEKEHQALQLESVTGRGEALAEVKSIIAFLREAEGTPEEEELRRRLKASLRWVVKEIWLRVQPLNGKNYMGHAQIYLHSGLRRYVQIFPSRVVLNPPPFWQLESADFREGDIGDTTGGTLPA